MISEQYFSGRFTQLTSGIAVMNSLDRRVAHPKKGEVSNPKLASQVAELTEVTQARSSVSFLSR